MSFEPQGFNEHQSNQQQSRDMIGLLKKSEISPQMAEYFKQKLNEYNPNESNEEQNEFEEDVYQKLSSGVYQISDKSQTEWEGQEQKQDEKQQIKIDPEMLQKGAHSESKKEEQAIAENTRQQYKEVDMPVQQFMQKVLSPKLQPKHPPNLDQEIVFTYPSLMDQSSAENQSNLKVQTSYQFQKQPMQEPEKSFLKDSGASPNVEPNLDHTNAVISQKQPQKCLEKLKITHIANQEKLQGQSPNMSANPIQPQSGILQGVQQKVKIVAIDESARLRILGYHKQYFLKIETQVYQIQFSSCKTSYFFERKFADFVLLDRLIRLKYPGSILYPIPENSLEFFKKIKLSVGTELEKAVLLEKRLLQLEKYLCFLLNHKQLRESDLFQTFIIESSEGFSRNMAQLQSTLEKEQYKFSESRVKENYKNIKSLVMSGLSYFSSYVSNKKNGQNTTLLAEIRRKTEVLSSSFAEIQTQLEKYRLATSNMQIKVQKLLQIYQSNSQMKPIESSIDSVLTLSSKMASSITAFELQKNWVEDKMLSSIYFFVHVFAQVQEQLQYRKSLLQKTSLIEQEEAKLGVSIIERVEWFDSQFVKDWFELKTKFEDQYFGMIDQFSKQWQLHCSQMSKIWK